MKNVVFIKLGGSIITNKVVPNQLRQEVLTQLVAEISRARLENPNRLIIVGHGHGSFGHVPAVKYQTIEGFINEDSRFGMAKVRESVIQLNQHVLQAFLAEGVPAVSLYPSNVIVTRDRNVDSYTTDVLEEYISQGLFPITCGDVMVDRGQGCTIWSTEEVLSFFAQQFVKKGWKVEQIIHVTEVEGFYDHQGKMIDVLTSKNWPDLKSAISTTKGFDSTGGMLTKVQESLALAEVGIDSAIISGLKRNNLYNLLMDKEWTGTRITQ